MAEAAVLAGLGWVASPIVRKLIANASTYVSIDMASELQELETTVLPQFELVIEAAEKSPHAAKLEKWLRKLKAAYYDAEDLLDEHQYGLLKRKAKRGEQTLSSPAVRASSSNAVLKPLRAVSSSISNLRPEKRKLLEKLNELKSILAEAKAFRELLGLQVGNGSERPSGMSTLGPSVALTSSHLASKVFGRDNDRDRIIDLLRTPTAADASGAAYSTLAMVGHGGAGKTTLAQYVYHDERVVKHFDVRMWVCISRKLDVVKHTREIIESASKGECPRIDNLDTLQCRLKDELLKSEKFLLVLDDVWFEESNNEREWETLLAPLVSQPRGSKVLVTSRSATLPSALSCEELVHLKDMEDTEFLALFKHHAFAGAEIREPYLRENLEVIAEKIAEKLRRSPLAAKTLGSQLSRKKDITAWRTALRNDKLRETMDVLLWSYQNLDPHLQRCFLYCSLFPKGYRFKADELIRLWVAEGFIDMCDPSSRIEDIGRNYFDEMVSFTFFVPLSNDGIGGISYNMHDLFHDLAEKLSKEDCFRLEDDSVIEIPCTVRHLSVSVESMIRHEQSICKLHNLRTIICIKPLKDHGNELFCRILQNSKKLHALVLWFYNGSKLPKSVGELKHLRYLNIIKTLISDLPESLCTLYHLQLLQLNHEVKSLPIKLSNLSKLRHLEAYENSSEVDLPQIPNVGKLTLLQHIKTFYVRKQKGHELRQLRDMKDLGGSLRITDLENASAKDEALEAMLHQKKHLEHLKLVWNWNNDLPIDDSLYLEVLEGLMPPPELKHLAIHGYKSAIYPRWLLQDSYFENLESFALMDCSSLACLPPNVQLFRHCRELCLFGVPNLETLPCLPESLKRLEIESCPLLIFISNEELERHGFMVNLAREDFLTSRLASIMEAAGTETLESFRNLLLEEHDCLKQLMTLMDADISEYLQTIRTALQRGDVLVEENTIRAWLYCQEQRSKLMYGRTIGLRLVLPSTLCELGLHSCSITDGALAICLGGLNSLRRLSLVGIMTLTTLPSEEVLRHLTMLEDLCISQCWCLRSLGGLRAATSLLEIIIGKCPSLEFAHDNGIACMPSSLQDLVIKGCILGDGFLCNDLPRLTRIHLLDCRSSASMSIGHLTSLETLILNGLPDLFLIEGLSSLQSRGIGLVNVPKLAAESFPRHHSWNYLCVSSSILLNRLFSIEGFTLPEVLWFDYCNEASITFECPGNFTSLTCLVFSRSGIKDLPKSLKSLSSLRSIRFEECPNISSLPDMPDSIEYIEIKDCKLLKESFQAPNGENWQKIAHIRWKDIR